MQLLRVTPIALTSVLAGGIVMASTPWFGSGGSAASPSVPDPNPDLPIIGGPGPVDPAPHACTGRAEGLEVGGTGGWSMLTESAADLDRELTVAREAGMFSIRVDLDWSVVERVDGTLDWSLTDRVVDAVLDHGMCPLLVVGFTPPWAQPGAGTPDSHVAPASAERFGRFARAAAEHYAGRVDLWEIWNEPNLQLFYKPLPDVDAYARLLAAAAAEIKAVDPAAFVVSGGLAPAVDNCVDIAAITFIERLYALGANVHFDAFAMHPYSYPALPNEPGTEDWNAASHMFTMRETMAAAGDGHKQIWLTEFGAPTGHGHSAVSAERQAEIITAGLDLVRAQDWLGPVYLYSIRDSGTDLADREQNFGLVDRGFRPKPALAAVHDAVDDA